MEIVRDCHVASLVFTAIGIAASYTTHYVALYSAKPIA